MDTQAAFENRERPFVLKNNSLAALKNWLKDRKYNSINDTLKDKKGHQMIGLSYRDNLEIKKAGLIIVIESEALDPAMRILNGQD
jgi:hypothetical protein